jgi:tRNA nucleotidyltransferase/poly(A) polymerase
MYEAVSKIIQPVYLVGGPVRDELLGRVPKDFDFTTPMLPTTLRRGSRRRVVMHILLVSGSVLLASN